MGIWGVPILTIENACASGTSALHEAITAVESGRYENVLALGVEKLYHEDKRKSFGAFSGAVDVEFVQEMMAALQQSAGAGGGSAGASGAGESEFIRGACWAGPVAFEAGV